MSYFELSLNFAAFSLPYLYKKSGQRFADLTEEQLIDFGYRKREEYLLKYQQFLNKFLKYNERVNWKHPSYIMVDDVDRVIRTIASFLKDENETACPLVYDEDISRVWIYDLFELEKGVCLTVISIMVALLESLNLFPLDGLLIRASDDHVWISYKDTVYEPNFPLLSGKPGSPPVDPRVKDDYTGKFEGRELRPYEVKRKEYLRIRRYGLYYFGDAIAVYSFFVNDALNKIESFKEYLTNDQFEFILNPTKEIDVRLMEFYPECMINLVTKRDDDYKVNEQDLDFYLSLLKRFHSELAKSNYTKAVSLLWCISDTLSGYLKLIKLQTENDSQEILEFTKKNYLDFQQKQKLSP